MRKLLKIFAGSLCLFWLFFSGTWLEEGMWLLDAVEKLPLAKYRNHGLELTPQQIYNPNGTSLKDAIVLLPGGTGGFVSNQGLIVTNHHIAFSGIQSLSSVHDDYLKNGFLARTRDEELSTSYTAEIVASMEDVTAEVMAAVRDTMTADQKASAVQTALKEIGERARSTNAELTYRTSTFYNGVKYYLFGYEVLRDVRLVFAPPSSIGNFGGEVDNWTWPRHTGDFALVRAYVSPQGKPAPYSRENIPYKPKMFLPLSSRGAVEGTFAMVMGFPGRTFRYQDLSSIRLAHDETLPALIDLYKTRVNIMEQFGKDDREVQIKYAYKLRRLANSFKNYEGVLEGMRRASFLEVKRKEADALEAFIQSSPELKKKYGSLLTDMQTATEDLHRVNRKNLMFANLTGAVELIAIANRFRGYAENPPVDSLGKVRKYSEVERAPMRDYIATAFKDLDIRVDMEMLVAMMLKNVRMREDQQIEYLRKITGQRSPAEMERRAREFANDLYEDSKLTSVAKCERLLLQDTDDILDDPFVKFAVKIAEEQGPIAGQVSGVNTTISRLRTAFTEVLLKFKSDPVVYPDANRTLRMTYGRVEPLEPRDAVHLSYITSLRGVMEKETGEEPFVVPSKLKELWEKKDFGKYYDATLGDVPVAFIAKLDITGGNSGSPVINGRGELIGCAFDGNWEAVVGDYYFQDKYNRSINVDSRYMLFILDKFAGAENIMKELVVR
jgi:hypothetical protein